MFESNNYKTDANLEIKGVWVDFIGGSKIKVASSDNPHHVQRLIQESKDNHLSSGDILAADADMLAAKRLADTILLDWQDFFEVGKPLPYTKEKAAQLLISIKPLLGAVNKAARDEALYRQKQAADIEKN